MNLDVASRAASPTAASTEPGAPRAHTGRRADRLWGRMQTPAAKARTTTHESTQERSQKELWENAPQARRARPDLRRNQLRSIVARADHRPAHDLTLLHELPHLQPTKVWYPNRAHRPQMPPAERLPPAIDAKPETPRTTLRNTPPVQRPGKARRLPALSPS